MSVLVLVSTKSLLGVLDQVSWTEGVPASVPDRHSGRGQPVVGKVVPRKGIPMRHGEDGHLHADKRILDRGRQVIGRVPLDVVWDGAQPDEDRQREALPVRGEDDELDAQELGHRPEGLQVVVHAHPEQT